eukprot:gb/GEZN01008922.1/.p1 GENE.gb/GEZN01008922.1/~~gb/GEZN01008922.1/.p1  ORF type:complete len:371 (-),score=-6.68 gb/GEZN01008922.1/:264-1346(-)
MFMLVCFPFTLGELIGLPRFSGVIFRTYWPSNLNFKDGLFDNNYTAANSWFDNEINTSGFSRWKNFHDIWRYRNYSSHLNLLRRRYYTEYFDAKLTGDGMITTSDAAFQIYSCIPGSKKTNLSCSDIPLDIVISVAWGWGSGHYHFPAECMSPISWLLDLFPDIQENVYIHVIDKTSYQMQWLELIGIPDSRVVSGSICAKRLLLASSECGSVGILQAFSLRKRLLNHLNSSRESNNSFLPLIINRNSRTYHNWRQLWSQVPHVPHDDTYLGNVETQLRRFVSAHMIIAVHGAGEINMITAKPGACIFEFFTNPKEFNGCYFTLAASLGFRYWGYATPNFSSKHVDEVLKHREECIPKIK